MAKKRKRTGRGRRLGRPETLKVPLAVSPPPPPPDPAKPVDMTTLPLTSYMKQIGRVAALSTMVPDELKKSLNFCGKVRDDEKVRLEQRLQATDAVTKVCKHINDMAVKCHEEQMKAGVMAATTVKAEQTDDGSEKTTITISVN